MNSNRFASATDWNDLDRKFGVRCWIEALLRALDRATPPILCCVFAATFAGGAIFGATRTALAALIIFLTFASAFGHCVRESSENWREFPYWLVPEDVWRRHRSVSAPIWAIGAAASAYLADFSWIASSTAFLYLAFVDLVATFWARWFGENVARKFRTFFPTKADASQETLENCKKFGVEKNVEFDEQINLENASEIEDDSGSFFSSQRRTRTTDGGERVFGSVAVEFEPNAEIAAIFISFCPPLLGIPTFEFEQISGPETALSATLVQPFGVRLEAKRRLNASDASSGEPICVEYFAAFPAVEE